MACRIADQAQGRQILVSSLLNELTESCWSHRFWEQVELKALAGLNRVYSVDWDPPNY